MTNYYPWKERRTQKVLRAFQDKITPIVTLVSVIMMLVFSPIGFGTAMWAHYFGFYRKNDSYLKRPAILTGVAVLLGIVFYLVLSWSPVEPISTLIDAGINGTEFSAQELITQWLFYGLPLSLLASAAWAAVKGWDRDIATQAYLKQQRITATQKARTKKNTEKFKNDDLRPDVFEIGVLHDDLIPWRQHRRGAVVGRPFKGLKHGFMLGSTGTGKTIALMNIVADHVDAGYGSVFLDFKGDPKTENMLAAIAHRHDRPFYSFWSNGRDSGYHYDPLGGIKGSPASAIITAFPFSTDGAASFYTSAVENYLNLQFAVLHGDFGVEKEPTESTMDWLLRTSNPKVLAGLLKRAAGSRNTETAAHAKRLIEQITDVNPKNLEGLTQNLGKVVSAIGDKMRPSPNSIDLRKAMDDGAVVFFGMDPKADKIIMRALGALVSRDLVTAAGERQEEGESGSRTDHKPCLVVSDEHGQLKSQAEVLSEMYSQGRAAKISVLISAQEFSLFDEDFVAGVIGNADYSIVLRVTESKTNETLTKFYQNTPVRELHSKTMRDEDSFSDSITHSGDGMEKIVYGARVMPEDIARLSDRTALVAFSAGDSQTGYKYRATPDMPAKNFRVKGEAQIADIPIVALVSRDYILESEDDTEGKRLVLEAWRADEPMETTVPASKKKGPKTAVIADDSELFDAPPTAPATVDVSSPESDSGQDDSSSEQEYAGVPEAWDVEVSRETRETQSSQDSTEGDSLKESDPVETSQEPVREYPEQKNRPHIDDDDLFDN